MRITGLLRTFHRVRTQLRVGLKPEEVGAFAAHVQSLRRQVEAICAQHGRSPDHLPAPSRMAYRFLKELDLGNLPVRAPDQVETQPTARVAIRNVVSIENHLSHRLWRELSLLRTSADARQQLEADLQRHAAAIEGICALQQATPGVLELPSRQVYCWLKFLLDQENLSAHLDALERASAALKQVPPATPLPVALHLVNMAALWRRRPYSDLVLLQVSEGFLNAAPEVWLALLKGMLSGRDPASTTRVREFAESEDFSEVLSELESCAEAPGASAQGCGHNLEASFTRVNAAYFDGAMARPRLVWNRALTGRKFGHYHRSTDTVMLSISLDAAEVPGWVVDFVMYHELLHKQLGVALVDGRRLVHSPAFRTEERRFREYAEAEQFLKALAAKH